jgi:hypothetical protein
MPHCFSWLLSCCHSLWLVLNPFKATDPDLDWDGDTVDTGDPRPFAPFVALDAEVVALPVSVGGFPTDPEYFSDVR